MNNKDLAYLVTDQELTDISYKSDPPVQTIHPRINKSANGPYVVCKKTPVPLVDFLLRLANSEPALRVAGYRKKGGKKIQTTISFNKKDRVSISPRLQSLLDKIRAENTTRSTKAIANDQIESDTIPGEQSKNPTAISINSALGSPVANNAEPSESIPVSEQARTDTETRMLQTRERDAVVKVRYGQGAFRDKLLTIIGDKCWMSGMEGKRLLIASHIKPWADCKGDTASRGNRDNGLLLSALWDSAFDSGLIGFDPDYEVVASSELSDSAKESLGLNEHIELPKKFRNDERKAYLAFHRANVFERWKKPSMPTGSQ